MPETSFMPELTDGQDTRGSGGHICGRFRLKGEIHPWTTFCEGLPDIEKGFGYYDRLYRHNYAALLPEDRAASVLVASAGVGYFMKFLKDQGYENVTGVDSDEHKVDYAKGKGFPVVRENVFDFLEETDRRFDLIFAEQEINHLTKRELVVFLTRARKRLADGGRLILNCTNYANPLTAIDHLAHNFNHYSGYTDNSLTQVLGYCGFGEISCHPLDNYVFFANPLNWVAKGVTGLFSLWFKAAYKMYGKAGHIFTKRMIAVGRATARPVEPDL